MKKLLTLLLFSFTVLTSYSQTVLLDDGFESYTDFEINNFGQWTGLDLDQLDTWTLGGDPAPPTNWYATWLNAGAKMAFQIFTPSHANVTNDATGISGEIRNFDPHGGIKYAGCWAAKMEVSGEGNKDWLISPAVTLGSSGNILTLWLKTLSISYGDERYRIGVYVGSGNPTSSSDFTIISGDYSPTESYLYASGVWHMDTYDLDAYAGQTVKIGVYCLTQEGSMLMVDDVKIITTGTITSSIPTTSNKGNYSEKIKVYPNPTFGKINVVSEKNIRNIEIYNTSGQKLKNIYAQDNISEFDKGTYILKINFEDNHTETVSILKK